MFIVCMLDSESYSEPDISFVETLDEAREYAMSTIRTSYGLYPEFCGATTDGRGERWSGENGDDFIVAEIFPLIPDATHVVVRWHGYDGVDFVVNSFQSYNEAAENYAEEKYDVDGEIECVYYDASNESYVLFDTGNEWEGIEIKGVNKETMEVAV